MLTVPFSISVTPNRLFLTINRWRHVATRFGSEIIDNRLIRLALVIRRWAIVIANDTSGAGRVVGADERERATHL